MKHVAPKKNSSAHVVMNVNNEYDKTDGLVPFEKWRQGAGVSRSTSWRWRRNGWVRAFHIGGKLYVNLNEVARFVSLAKSGEFAKQPPMPTRKAQQAEQLTGPGGGSA